MKQYYWNQLSESQQGDLLQRPVVASQQNIRQQTADIIDVVRREGDSAVKFFTSKFDKANLDNLAVSKAEFVSAAKQVSKSSMAAMEHAIENITTYHKAQQTETKIIETAPGICCIRKARAIRRVGLYVPGGSAPLISTLLMLAIPAKLAGCPMRIICTPPNCEGVVDPRLLVAAQRCGVERVFKVGGAQAIAAMAYGTQSIPKVDKIFGPGNSWVTEAKLLVAQDPAGAYYDLPAGPSEVLIIADDTATPRYVAADLLSQAEHGPDSQVILVTTSQPLAEQVLKALEQQLTQLPRREIAMKSLQHSHILLVENIEQALQISNDYAPEHLILEVENAEQYMGLVMQAGTVFLGHWAPETMGDYVTGSNHVLPTYGYARSLSGLSLTDFIRFISFQSITPKGLKTSGPFAAKLAEDEGLHAHQRAVQIRLNYLEGHL